MRLRWLTGALSTAAVFVFVAAGGAAPAVHAGSGQLGQIVFGTLHAGEDEIWVMNEDGSGRHNLTRHDGAKISDIDPRWSPDGQQIAYSSDPGGSRQIWIMNADGSGAHAITQLPGSNRYPSWTADGNAIVFQSLRDGNFDIYRVNVDGTGITNLTKDPAVDWAPATSAHGNKVVFTSERDGNGHLYVLDADGSLQKITDGPGYDFYADWSPRANLIAFVREDATGESDLYLIRADGSDEQRLTFTPATVKYFPAFSPDGRKIAFTSCSGYSTSVDRRCTTHLINADATNETSLEFPAAPTSFPFIDTFDDGIRDVEHWHLIHDGTGVTVNETSGQLEFTVAADAAPTSDDSAIAAHMGFHCLLNGDFDVQVDYQLLDWPPANGVSVQLHAFFGEGATSRSSGPWGESYGAFVLPDVTGGAATTDTSGTLRITRTGTTMTTYYKSGDTWVATATGPVTLAPTVVALEVASYNDFSHQQVRVAFDNFRIDATNADCSSWRPDWHPDFRPSLPTSRAAGP